RIKTAGMDVFTTANRIHVHTSQSQPRPVSGSVKQLKQKFLQSPHRGYCSSAAERLHHELEEKKYQRRGGPCGRPPRARCPRSPYIKVKFAGPQAGFI
ncbi:MAG: hypothetical protein ABR955_15475, partial [Verrucomicrobiota bacterium]